MGKFANSGWVTEIGPDEWKEYAHFDALGGFGISKKYREESI
jgi:hypothetical protein